MKLQLQRMHKQFGREHVHKCGDCGNLLRNTWDKAYFKCARYGESNCEATDWAKSWPACGKFNVPLEDGERPLIKYCDRTRPPQGEVPGQIRMEG